MLNWLISSWTVFLLTISMFWCDDTVDDETFRGMKPVTGKPKGVVTEIHNPGFYTAWVKITYRNNSRGIIETERWEIGRYGTKSKIASESGVLVHVRHGGNLTTGCAPPEHETPNKKWIALVQRGSCSFHDKIHNHAKKRDAAAVIIYDSRQGGVITMHHNGKCANMALITCSQVLKC